ncbi:hypothetical protein HYV64_03735 [Candidatus Shapirobacteria bacterium]|nr:hypothetical protein [Candidatus Shapirobacteria bacterium]
MTKKIILTTIVLSSFSLLLSACSSVDKLRVNVETETDSDTQTYSEDISTAPTTDPSTLSDDQLLLQMESESNAQIDQEFSRLDSELE